MIHEEPTHPNFIHPAFTINPDRGTVAIQVSVNDFPGDYDSYYSDYRKLVQGLVYDRASHEIRYGDTVCAEVSEHRFLITRWHFSDETEACAFEERQKEVVVDNGFDNPYSYAVTEVYLTVTGESIKSASAISPASPAARLKEDHYEESSVGSAMPVYPPGSEHPLGSGASRTDGSGLRG